MGACLRLTCLPLSSLSLCVYLSFFLADSRSTIRMERPSTRRLATWQCIITTCTQTKPDHVSGNYGGSTCPLSALFSGRKKEKKITHLSVPCPCISQITVSCLWRASLSLGIMGRANPASPTQNPVLKMSLMYWLARRANNWKNSITSRRDWWYHWILYLRAFRVADEASYSGDCKQHRQGRAQQGLNNFTSISNHIIVYS